MVYRTRFKVLKKIDFTIISNLKISDKLRFFIVLKICLKIKIFKKNNNDLFNIDIVLLEGRLDIIWVHTCASNILGDLPATTLSISVDMIKKNVTYINNVVIYRNLPFIGIRFYTIITITVQTVKHKQHNKYE